MKKSMLIVVGGALSLLSACKANRNGEDYAEHKTGYESADSASAATEKSASADSTQLKAKLVKTAEIQFKVKDVLKTSETIASIINQEGGLVMNHHLETIVDNEKEIRLSDDSVKQVSVYTTKDEMMVRVPQQQLTGFMNEVSHISTQVISMRMDIEDRSINYLEARLKAKNRSEVEAYQQKEKPTTKSASALLALKDDKAAQQITNLRTDAEIKYSTVSLSFSQQPGINIQRVANTDLSGYDSPVGSRFWASLVNGWVVFVDMLIAIANLWMFMILALAGWLGYRYYRKRQGKPLVANI